MVLKRCDCGAFINRVGSCPNCGQVMYEIDPLTKLRRRARDMLNKAPIETVIKVVKVLGVK